MGDKKKKYSKFQSFIHIFNCRLVSYCLHIGILLVRFVLCSYKTTLKNLQNNSIVSFNQSNMVYIEEVNIYVMGRLGTDEPPGPMRHPSYTSLLVSMDVYQLSK